MPIHMEPSEAVASGPTPLKPTADCSSRDLWMVDEPPLQRASPLELPSQKAPSASIAMLAAVATAIPSAAP